MRFPIAILFLLPILLVACATPTPPTARSGAKAPPPRVSTITPAAPRWKAVPAKADGVAVPGGRRHIVKRGETGIAIAIAYGVPWNRIAGANGLERDSILQVGQALFVPMAPARTASPPPARTSPGRSPARQAPAQPAASADFQLDIDDVITGSAPAGDSPAPPSPAQPRPASPAAAPAAAAQIPPLAWPVDGRVILSRYGAKPGGRFNDGLNIKTLRGATVRAAADGEILYVGDAIAGFGLMILIRHPTGTVTAYGHLEDALASRGDKVQRGQPIARAGTSGTASEPQLHFQLRQGRKTLDPMLYLPR